MRVLLAEDTEYSAETMLALLGAHYPDMEINHCINGVLAARAFKDSIDVGDEPYSLVITDLQMPRKNGIELAEFIREMLDSKIPIFLWTGAPGDVPEDKVGLFTGIYSKDQIYPFTSKEGSFHDAYIEAKESGS